MDVTALRTVVSGFIAAYSAQQKTDKEKDKFNELRGRIIPVFDDYAKDPTNPELLRRAQCLVEELERLELTDGTVTAGRASVNRAVLSARIRRTHYAAYVAGKLSVSEQLGSKFKCWLHNAAANGAMGLYEHVHAITQHPSEQADAYALLRLFGEGARADAERFVALSRAFDPTSVLAAYNEAKLDILSQQPQRVRRGVERITGIAAPESGGARMAEAADISWHIDNYLSFKDPCNRMMHDVLRRECPERISVIEAILDVNSKKAQEIKDERGDIWREHTAANRTVVAGAAVGMLACAIGIAFPGVQDLLADLISRSIEYMVTAADAPSLSDHLARGDGGVAGAADVAMRGDGGVANSLMEVALRGDGGVASLRGDGGVAAEALRCGAWWIA